jgi:D-alanyl-D-alanine carboxypeptidase (penicillin-binding protein 5/6)
VFDRVDFLERDPARALGEQGDLPLPVCSEVARSVRRPGDSFSMTEQVDAHDDKLGQNNINANRSCPQAPSVNQSRVRFAAIAALLLTLSIPAEAAIDPRYTAAGVSIDGMICVDAATGAVLSEDKADFPGHPASVTKLMTTLLVLEDIKANQLTMRSRVTATKAAANTGGSQVWLAAGESFTIEEMLYALMLQSANDVAVALAIDRGGDVPTFVARMNRRAAELGMTRTTFVTPNGLTYGRGPHDTTTARDLAKLAVALCRFPELLKFTSTKQYMFRRPGKPFELLNHNHLLNSFPGCDGLKTGWTVAAHASIVTTAKDKDVRVIAIVLGCQCPAGAKPEQRLRDSLAADLMSHGLDKLKKLEAEKSLRQAQAPAFAPARKLPVKAKKEEGFWDWLVDLFSF